MTSSRTKREIAYVAKPSTLCHRLQDCRLMSYDWKCPSHLPADELKVLTRQTFEFFTLRLELKKSLAYKLLIKQLVSTKARQLNLSVIFYHRKSVPRHATHSQSWMWKQCPGCCCCWWWKVEKAAGDAGKAKSRLKWIKRQIGFYFSDDFNFKFISDSPNLCLCALQTIFASQRLLSVVPFRALSIFSTKTAGNRYCGNLSGDVALIVWFTTNGMRVKNNTIICVPRTNNSKRDCEHDLYCCLLPRCEALRTCCSGFPIATIHKKALFVLQ